MRYLISYAALEFVNFRKIEFESLTKIFDVNYQVVNNTEELWLRPYVVVELESDDIALAIAERSVLIKCVYHLWSEGGTLVELIGKVVVLYG